MRRGDRWRRLSTDAGLALGLLVFGYVGTMGAADNFPDSAPLDPPAWALVAVAALAVAVRRQWPLVTLALATAATTVYLVANYPYGPIMCPLFVAVYTVARHLPVRRASFAGGLALVALLAHVFVSRGEPVGLAGVIPGTAWMVVPFAVGATIRVNREAAARDRAAQVRRVADDERLRVAQEVHDVVGHGLAAINMQAEIALHLLAKRPEQAETALAAISRSSREALDELRVTLSVVRQDAAAERAPVPGLGQVDALTARLRRTGLPVTLEVTGDRRPLPVAVDLTAYRVVQEALTNVLRHAGAAATATVRIGYPPDAVTVEVVDTGHGGPGMVGVGHGVTGMRERAAALGGALEVGPLAAGGFRVFARLPVETRG